MCAGTKVQSANTYTMGPSLSIEGFLSFMNCFHMSFQGRPCCKGFVTKITMEIHLFLPGSKVWMWTLQHQKFDWPESKQYFAAVLLEVEK